MPGWEAIGLNAINQIFNFLRSPSRIAEKYRYFYAQIKHISISSRSLVSISPHVHLRFAENISIFWERNGSQREVFESCLFSLHFFFQFSSMLFLSGHVAKTLKYTSHSKKLISLDKLLCFAQQIFKKRKKFLCDLKYE